MDSVDGFEFHASSAQQHSYTMLQVNSVGLVAPPVVLCHNSPGPSSPVLFSPAAHITGTSL